MPRSILVPLDGSPFGEEALPMGASIARRAAARLHLVHVCPALPGEPALEDGAERARAYLGEVTAGVCEELGSSCSFTVLEPPPQRGIGLAPPSSGISEVLHDYAEANGIELVVMTTHGRSGLSRAWLGSVADAFVRHTSVPVLLLRPGRGPRAARAEARSFETVLVPVDGSAASEEILAPALALAAEGARIFLLRVISPAFDMGSPYIMSAVHVDAVTTRERRVQAEEALARTAEALRARGVSVTTTTAVDPVPADAILGFAEENAVDCIAMATRGLGGWSRMVLGSTADKVVRAATLPVLVLRPEPARDVAGAAPELAARAV